jgi:hypothetical protein
MIDKPPPFDFDHYPGLSDPNWTQVPDEVLDFMLPSLSGAEVKTFLYILRRTFGFKRDADRITLAQLCDGRKRTDGTHLDYGTGLSRRAVIEAVKGLEAKSLVQVARGTTEEGTTDANVYRVVQAGSARVQKSNPEGAESAPPRVQKSNPLYGVVRKKELRKKEQQQQQPLADLSEAPPPGPGPAPEAVVVVASLASTAEQQTTATLTERMRQLGVAESTATTILGEFNLDHVYRWVCYAEHRLAAGWVPRESPAAWLVSAIRSGDWVIPGWFRTPEDEAADTVQRLEAATAEHKQQELEAEQERHAAEAQRQAIERALGIGDSTRALWEKAKSLLEERRQFSPALFSAYLLPLRGGKAVITTPVEFFCGVIEARRGDIRSALEEAGGRTVGEVEVRYTALQDAQV